METQIMIMENNVGVDYFTSTLEFLNVNGANSCDNPIPDPSLASFGTYPGSTFSFFLHQRLYDKANVLISPLSVLMTLGMASEGGDHSKFKNIITHIFTDGVRSMTRAKSAFQHYHHSLCPKDKFTLSMANRIYVQNNFPLEPTFTEKLKTFGEAEYVDFHNNPSSVIMYINQWVEQQTLNTIKDLLSFDISYSSVLLLINTVYFNGKWDLTFDAALTKPITFNTANGRPIPVPTMFIRHHFNYTFDKFLNSQVLQLNYEGGRFAMFIVLPKSGTDVQMFKLWLYNNIMFEMKNLTVQLVEVHLPKFKASSRQVLTAPLVYFEMGDLVGNLSLMMSNSNLKVSRVAHQAFVELDEEGSLAATATALANDFRSEKLPQPPHPQTDLLPPSSPLTSSPIQFKVDRPCFYLICDIILQNIQFMGNLDYPPL